MKPIKTELVIVGGGPGGYAAAFYAAAQGKKVLLVEQDDRLGGVCLNRGCIPSKAYLHATKLIDETRGSGKRGVVFASPKIDLKKMRAWKESILDKLGGGIQSLAKARRVTVLHGRGHFEESGTLRVETSDGQKFVNYELAIVAVGSKAVLPKAFDLGNPRIMTSREALDLPEVPGRMLVIGGGYIGMELGTVYAFLGSRIVVAEALDTILAGADPDLVKPVSDAAAKRFEDIRLGVKVKEMATSGKQIKVVMDVAGGKKTVEEKFDRVLISVGRAPNCDDLGLGNTAVKRDDRGFIEVDGNFQTADPGIYAIGDVIGGTMLAHKASREARLAVDAILGQTGGLNRFIVPAVIYTDPEVAWCGLTEQEAKQKKIKVEVAKFPWSASGRALTFDRPDGVTKLVIDPETDRVLGVGIAGHGAAELIAEGVLAIEMGATVEDLAETVHPHPTLSETLMEAAASFYGYSAHAVGRKPKA